MQQIRKSHLVLLLSVFLSAACGVKSDPLPPESPVEMSRGRPNFQDEENGETKTPKKNKKDQDSRAEGVTEEVD